MYQGWLFGERRKWYKRAKDLFVGMTTGVVGRGAGLRRGGSERAILSGEDSFHGDVRPKTAVLTGEGSRDM